MPLNEVTQVAKGVYIFPTGGLNPMFVEFKDFILAVEAPAQHPTLERVPADAQAGSDQISERFIQKIKETIPNKPIRYLAVTHFHSDHAGGARAFLAEGATLLTTPGNKDYFETLAAAKYTVVPDKLSRQPRVNDDRDVRSQACDHRWRTLSGIDQRRRKPACEGERRSLPATGKDPVSRRSFLLQWNGFVSRERSIARSRHEILRRLVDQEQPGAGANLRLSRSRLCHHEAGTRDS